MRRGTVVNMILNMVFVVMDTDRKLIQALYQHKFSVGGLQVAEIGGHRFQLLRVQTIVKAVFQTLDGHPLGDLFVGLDICRGRGRSSISQN